MARTGIVLIAFAAAFLLHSILAAWLEERRSRNRRGNRRATRQTLRLLVLSGGVR